jgi:hypothetical protein
MRQDAVAIQRARIADRRAVCRCRAGDDALPVEVSQPRDAGPVHAATGVAEEHGVDIQRNDIVWPAPGQRAVRRRDDNLAGVVRLQHADGIGTDQSRLTGHVTQDETGALGNAGRRSGRYGRGAHEVRTGTNALARRTTECGGTAIDVAYDAVFQHVVAVADMAGLRIRDRRGEIDLIEVIEPANAGAILADAGIVHDDRADAPFGRIEGIVFAAIGPRDDNMGTMLGANERAAGNCRYRCPCIGCAHLFSIAAQPRLDLGVVQDLSGKTILLGVLDMGRPDAETAEEVADRIRAGLRHIAPERLIPAPDCGMEFLPRAVAFAKLKALAEGAAIVRRELGG